MKMHSFHKAAFVLHSLEFYEFLSHGKKFRETEYEKFAQLDLQDFV